jgi:sterol desaturase/sphingolipid hydroxylase (fatty acid hydroxylase superfamily)
MELLWQKLVAFHSEPSIVIFAIPIFLLLIGLEILLAGKDLKSLYQFRDSVSSISMGIGVVFIDLITKSLAFLLFWYMYEYARFFTMPMDAWWAWLLLFFLDDFSFYWHHRVSHEVRLFWAAHVNHHSSEQYNLSTALRQSWTEVIYKYAFWLWLPFLGFPPFAIFTMMGVSLIYQFWVHTKLIRRFPKPIELLFNTPSHHRVHHASNVNYLDKNYAGILIIWDRLFGTFAPERDEEPVVYGITTNLKSYNLLHIAFHEYQAIWKDIKRAPTWRMKLKYLYMPPGWSHDGPDQRAKTLQRSKQKL